jgi:uncharacterized protein (DUF736 family)
MTTKEKTIGALWTRESKKGMPFLSGNIKINGVDTKIICFMNSYKKEGDNKPDWTIQISETATYKKPEEPSIFTQNNIASYDDSDIPF